VRRQRIWRLDGTLCASVRAMLDELAGHSEAHMVAACVIAETVTHAARAKPTGTVEKKDQQAKRRGHFPQYRSIIAL
jgi:hypothetical protein